MPNVDLDVHKVERQQCLRSIRATIIRHRQRIRVRSTEILVEDLAMPQEFFGYISVAYALLSLDVHIESALQPAETML
jgi:hypothetical protein